MTNKMENINDVTMERNYTVYMHVSPNGKVYIGITCNKPKYRWNYGYGYKHNKYFWRSINKYGWDNFKHIIIDENLTKEQAENMEIELIKQYRSNERNYGYNIESGGNSNGKVSEETRKKISESNKGKKHTEKTKKKMRENHKSVKGCENPTSKKVFCDTMIFECVVDCANYYGINYGTMTSWLKGKNSMNLDFQQLNLRYATNDDLNKYEKYDANKHGDKSNKINKALKFIYCDNLIFNSITDCANYYSISISTMYQWIKGTRKMPLDFQQLNLRYATNNDLDTYPRYTPVNN